MTAQAGIEERILLTYKNPLVAVCPRGKKGFTASSDVVFTTRRLVLVEREFDPRTHPATASQYRSNAGLAALGGAGVIGVGLGILIGEAIDRLRGVGSDRVKARMISTESIDLLIQQELAIGGTYNSLRFELFRAKIAFLDRITGEPSSGFINVHGAFRFGNADLEGTVTITPKELFSKVSKDTQQLPCSFSEKQY